MNFSMRDMNTWLKAPIYKIPEHLMISTKRKR